MNCEVGASNISSWQMAMKSAALRIHKQDPAFRDLMAKVDFIFFEIHAAALWCFSASQFEQWDPAYAPEEQQILFHQVGTLLNAASLSGSLILIAFVSTFVLLSVYL
jgi:hypothetical protein